MTIVAFSLFSCGSTQNTTSIDEKEASITDIYWALEELDGQTFSDANIRGKEIGFKLNAKGQKVSGFGGCNNFMAVYNVAEGNRIRFDAIGSTKMACPEEDFSENDFLSSFDRVDGYKMDGEKLVLTQGEATVAIFKKSDGMEVTTPSITDRTWVLKTLDGQDVGKSEDSENPDSENAASENEERDIFFRLDSDRNTVHGYAGCNTFNGSFSLEKGDRIRFGMMAATMRACPDSDVNESEFLKVFELADNYSVDGDTLYLNVGRRAALAVFVEE